MRATIIRMISTGSPSLFRNSQVNRPEAATPARPADPVRRQPVDENTGPTLVRTLNAVPAQPERPLPRGSLLDLRL